MDSILEVLRRFLKESENSYDKEGLYFKWCGNQITYSDALSIIEVVDSLQMTLSHLQEQCSEYKDYNRLLRKENEELRGGY